MKYGEEKSELDRRGNGEASLGDDSLPLILCG